MLSAKNNLISNWIDYKVLRIGIFASLELLYLDENGVWINEDFDLQQLKDYVQQSDYFPAELNLPQVTSASENSFPRSEDLSAGEGEASKQEVEANQKPDSQQTSFLLPGRLPRQEDTNVREGQPTYGSVISIAAPPILAPPTLK